MGGLRGGSQKCASPKRQEKKAGQEDKQEVKKCDYVVKSLSREIVYSFEEAPNWARIIWDIREEFDKCDREEDKFEHLPVTCRDGAGQDIVLNFNMKDVYFVGFTLGTQNYEFGNVVNIKLPKSECLGYGCGYGDMKAGNVTGVGIGYNSLTNALHEMIKGPRPGHNWKNDIKTRIPTVLVMLPECVRFKWHYLAVKRMMTGDDYLRASPTVSGWMEDGIKHWKDASEVAFKKEHTDSTNGKPPRDDVYSQADMNKALKDKDWVWARDLLAVPCVVKREPLNVLKEEKGWDGKEMVPYWLVLWNNMEVEWQTVSQMQDMFHDFSIKEASKMSEISLTPPKRHKRK